MQFIILLLLAACTYYVSAVKFEDFAKEFKEAVKNRTEAQYGPVEGNSEPNLLLAEPYGLTRINIKKSIRRLVMRDISVSGIDYHLGRSRIYWSNPSTGTIFARPLNVRGSAAVYQQEAVIERSPLIWSPRAIAVDHVADRLYVLDSRGHKVHAFDLDGKSNAVVYENKFFAPLDLALDPHEGLMFIADGNKILRVSMDGSSPVEIAGYPKYKIKSVALDLENKRVFWADAKFHRVKSANYDGSDLKIVLKNHPSEIGKRFTLLGPTKLVYHQGRVYIYDEVYRHVSSVDLEGGPSTYRIVYDKVDVKAMKMIASESQTPAANPCGEDNGRCDNLCVIAAKSDGPEFTCL